MIYDSEKGKDFSIKLIKCNIISKFKRSMWNN